MPLTYCVVLCSSVHMEEASVMQGAQGMLVQNWPTVSSAAGEKEHEKSVLLQSNDRKLIMHGNQMTFTLLKLT